MVVKTFEPMSAFVSDGGIGQLGGWSVISMDGSALGRQRYSPRRPA